MVDAILPSALDPAQILMRVLPRPSPIAAQLVLTAELAAITSSGDIAEHLNIISSIDPSVLCLAPAVDLLANITTTSCRGHTWHVRVAHQNQERLSNSRHCGGSPQPGRQFHIDVKLRVLAHQAENILLTARVRKTHRLEPWSRPREDDTNIGVLLEVLKEDCRHLLRDVLSDLDAHHPIEFSVQVQGCAKVRIHHKTLRGHFDILASIVGEGRSQPCVVQPSGVLSSACTKVPDRRIYRENMT
mmetsp:Transcript_29260/g.44204  ORF Transcript_29260/g.44204 Transcript_29260/m.44204 type:complete len:244 (+) Transcript_29260:231-962(+)|eukprot:CAMPEP_0195002526 /NCGR_PEP_ID=MMETSP0326_2-20130528/2692_1 /TAXON_ID=2866 ORGANISM="Crypthecodinium cohnii, Strain Seligo" /NCGR_SAMPLE_ID=MMETSP0326_2 /ASSEMBLY_ACC=CAM_ASM_000348 /LENGTH=243 /DNA_ID=CAMNT_0040006213 /DNA_START=216 /DNA_END=947 /DNA_ORIENTATION=+